MADREKMAADELAIVLSHYDLGIIEQIKEYPRGSRRAPKLLLRTEKGEFLLKRRARGKDDPFKVAFAHSLQLYLATRQYPLPHLVGTRRDNNSMLQYGDAVYELFEYIRGEAYDGSLMATEDSGRVLSLYHKLVHDYTPEFEPPVGSFHDSKAVPGGLEQIPQTFSRKEGVGPMPGEEKVRQTLAFLRDAYGTAVQKVNGLGLNEWPAQIVHCDWHPGNMLFRNGKVVAVIDYDAARLQQRVMDIANGALQFSIIGGANDPGEWPDYLDERRYACFIRGYDAVDVVSTAELEVIPWLMIEAMVAESVLPIAATGSFGRIEGYGFLQMIERKVRWVLGHMPRLLKAASG